MMNYKGKENQFSPILMFLLGTCERNHNKPCLNIWIHIAQDSVFGRLANMAMKLQFSLNVGNLVNIY
jgi:hypothetical protein